VLVSSLGALVGHAQVAGTSRRLLPGRPEERGLHKDDRSHVSRVRANSGGQLYSVVLTVFCLTECFDIFDWATGRTSRAYENLLQLFRKVLSRGTWLTMDNETVCGVRNVQRFMMFSRALFF